jgi:hypothetical protein
MPEEAKPIWQRKKQVQWGAAVKNPQNAPVESEKNAEESKKIPIQENRVEFKRNEPVENIAAKRVIKPIEVEEKSKPTIKHENKDKIVQKSKKDPEPLIKVINKMPGKGTTAQERPDPDLYEPAHLRRRTPRRVQRDPYEVSIRSEKNKRGEDVLKVDLPKRERIFDVQKDIVPPSIRKETPKPTQRERLPASTIMRIVLMTLLGIALGAGFIWLDEWLAMITG